MSKIFSVVNFECHDSYCCVAKQIFSRTLRVSSKWRGRVICEVNNVLSLNFFWRRINEQKMYKKGLKYCHKRTAGRWTSRIAGSEKGQASSVTLVALVARQQQSLRRCFNLLAKSFESSYRLQPESLKPSSQYHRET